MASEQCVDREFSLLVGERTLNILSMLVHGGRQLHVSQQPGRYDEQFEAKQSRGTSSLSSAKFTFTLFLLSLN